MEYVNLHVSSLDSAEFKSATPEQQGTWLCALRYACGQEEGGVIANCRNWTERQWQTVVGAEKRILLQPCGLWEWKEDNLIVGFYALDQERLVRSKRRGGRLGNRRRWSGHWSESHSESDSDSHRGHISDSHSESEMKGNEMKGNERGTPRHPDFPEIEVPGLGEFVAACELRGVPRAFAEAEHAWRSERPAERWPRGANWQTAVTSTFNRWRERGVAPQKNGADKKRERWQVERDLESVQSAIEEHPRASWPINKPLPDDVKNDYAALLAKSKALSEELTTL